MAKWEQLIRARERLHLSQMEAAEQVKVGLATYQRWETGQRKPQPHNMRQLVQVFGALLDDVMTDLLITAPAGEETDGNRSAPCDTGAMERSAAAPIVNPEPLDATVIPQAPEATDDTLEPEGIDEPRAFIASHMITHLWHLGCMEHPTCDDKRCQIRQAIEEFDRMNSTNKNYQISRREALCSLATLPMITLGLTLPGKTLEPKHYGAFLTQCTASLEGCWELYRSSEVSDAKLAFKSASKYLPILETIAHNASQYRQEALDLATRYALLKTLLGWTFIGPTETLQYARHALALSKETGDIALQLSAYVKLAWGYFYHKQDILALTTMKEAEALLQQYTRLPNAQPLHPVVQSTTYSSLALMQARNGKPPDAALGKVSEVDPGEVPYAVMNAKHSTLLLEAGWTYCYYGDQVKAMQALEQRVDPETLTPKIAQSEMGRVETINIMALSSLRAKDRDMEKTIHFWTAGIEGAKARKDEQRFLEAMSTYELMDVVWPGEPRIQELRDLIQHW